MQDRERGIDNYSVFEATIDFTKRPIPVKCGECKISIVEEEIHVKGMGSFDNLHFQG